jgi:hypothetical protein
VATAEPAAIIDIGSNSVRLVVYAGPPRIPTPIFNEKVLAGLGSGADPSGPLPAEPRERTLSALRRFRLLIDHMKVKQTRVVATAAIRDAADGDQFVREVDRTDAADGIRNIAKRSLAAAGEAIEVERYSFDAVVVPGRVERRDDVAQAELLTAGSGGDVRPFGPRGLLDDVPLEVEVEHPIVDRRLLHRQAGINRSEEEQHEKEDERVLDSDQQLPDGANEFHFRTSSEMLFVPK